MQYPREARRPQPDQLREMIRAARAGDAAARIRVLEVLRPYLIVIGLSKMGQRLQARFAPSDAAQVTIFKAYRHFSQFGGCAPESLRRWVDEIHSNVIHDAHRRYLETRKRGDGCDLALDDLETQVGLEQLAVSRVDEAAPSKQYSTHERQAVVAMALLKLPSRQREVLRLKYLEQLSYTEAGARLGITEKAARMAAARGRKSLKIVLERLHEEEY